MPLGHPPAIPALAIPALAKPTVRIMTNDDPRDFPAPGCWPWDHWQRFALAAGLTQDLATLGRAVMREADQHAWCERLKAECGQHDAGRAMLARVLKHPARTAARWQWLLVTDGQRFDPWEHDELYEDSPCWKSHRARWNREQAREARN